MINKKIVYVIRFMMVLIITFMVYHLYFRPGDTIYVQSYDREYDFVLTEYPTERLIENIDAHFNETIFFIKDEDSFIKKHVLTHPSYVKSYQYHRNAGDEEYTIYYFVEDGYGFYLKKDLNNLYSLNPSIIQIHNEEVEVISQFIPASYVIINQHYNFEDMKTKEFISFDDYVEFYRELSLICYTIDVENKTIYLRSYNCDNQEVDNDYWIVLTFDDEGFIATIMEIE